MAQSTAHRRLLQEYRALTNNPPEGITAGPVSEDDLLHWEALIQGPEGTPFEGGVFPAELKFPKDYPLAPPTMRFLTDMWHPNSRSLLPHLFHLGHPFLNARDPTAHHRCSSTHHPAPESSATSHSSRTPSLAPSIRFCYFVNSPKLTMDFFPPLSSCVVYASGLVCISILHAPGDDPNHYEHASERWSPIQSVEKILISVMSMLAEPNDESPANVEAAKMWRDRRAEYEQKVKDDVRKSLGL